MNICHNCGHENPREYHFCTNCAATLASICPKCSNLVPIDNKFCGYCGKQVRETPILEEFPPPQLITPARSLEYTLDKMRVQMPSSMTQRITDAASESIGQRREVTVMFIDVANFTATSRSIGTEDSFMMMEELMDMMVNTIYRYEGTIDKFTGDGLIALFGIPLNHENDPERAIRAALDIHEAILPRKTKWNTDYDLDLGIRIGVNTGVVIAGKLGSKYHMEYTVIGDTVNLASRLETYAEPGTTLISFQTYKRVRHIFSIEIVRPITIKGYTHPIQVYKPTGLRTTTQQVRGKIGFQAPMIGRQDSLNLLNEVFSRTQTEKITQIISISGEAGLGKTRLIEEFRKSKAESATKFRYGSCGSYMRVTPYHVIRRIIRNIMHISDSDSTRAQMDAVLNHMAFLGINENDVLPYILHVLELPQLNLFSETQLSALDTTMLQRQTHAALRKFLTAEAEFSPTVFIFDDLHWVDQASREFLEYFSQAVETPAVMIILVSRDFQYQPVLQRQTEKILDANNKLSRIELQPLTVEQSRALIDNIIQKADLSVNKIKDFITNRTDGNPYYTEELIRVLIENEGLFQADNVWQTTSIVDNILKEIPSTLKDIILARFDRLPEHLQHILQKSAILGQSFALFLLGTQVNFTDEILSEHLSELEQKEFLIMEQEGIDVVYSFKQAIVRDTIYETILKRDRMIYHYQVAETIKDFTFWLPGEKSEILAYHLGESSKPLEAIQYLITAGENATNRFAMQLATQHYQDALDLMQGTEDIQLLDYARVRIGLGKSKKYAGDFNGASTVFNNAIDQMEHYIETAPKKKDVIIALLIEGFREMADLRAREGQFEAGLSFVEKGIAMLGDTPQTHYPSLWRKLVDRIAWILFRQGRLEEANDAAKQVLEKVSKWALDDPVTLASINNTLGGIHWMQSHYQDAIQYVNNSFHLYNKINYHWGKAIASTNLGVLHFSSGNYEDAVSFFERADAIQVEQGYTPDRPTNLKNLGEVLMNLGHHKTSMKRLAASRDISRQLGMTINEAYAEIGLCRLSYYNSDMEAASEHLRTASTLLEDSKDQIDDRNISLLLLEAMILCEKGETEVALSLSKRALDMANDGGFPTEESEALRVYGTICAEGGNYQLAEETLQNGIQLASKQKNPYREARARYELGRIYSKISREADDVQNQEAQYKQAKIELDLAIGQFTRLGAQYDLGKAQNALDMLSIPGQDQY